MPASMSSIHFTLQLAWRWNWDWVEASVVGCSASSQWEAQFNWQAVVFTIKCAYGSEQLITEKSALANLWLVARREERKRRREEDTSSFSSTTSHVPDVTVGRTWGRIEACLPSSNSPVQLVLVIVLVAVVVVVRKISWCWRKRKDEQDGCGNCECSYKWHNESSVGRIVWFESVRTNWSRGRKRQSSTITNPTIIHHVVAL